MDTTTTPITTAYVPEGHGDAAVFDLVAGLTTGDPSAVLFFNSVDHDGTAIAAAIEARHPDAHVIGCTTAGEFTERGTGTGGISAIALPRTKTASVASALARFDDGVDGGLAVAVAELERQLGTSLGQLDPERYVGVVLIDGLHGAEEHVNELLGNAAPFLSFVGGSAGDDLAFAQTAVYAAGGAAVNGAALMVLELDGPFAIVKTCSFESTGAQLQVTRSDTAERIVWEFDGRPAAEAYAEAVGCSVAELDGSVFMKSPLGLMIDGEPWIRSPQQLVEGGGLKFYCQIIEGMEMDVMRSTDLIGETRSAITAAAESLGHAPAGALLFNCILRRLEIDADGLHDSFVDAISVCPAVGFHTYGESYIGHINQTLTGILIG
jgi:hypothetical protein